MVHKLLGSFPVQLALLSCLNGKHSSWQLTWPFIHQMYISSDVSGGRVRTSMVDIMFAVFDCAMLQLLSVVYWLP